MGSSFTEFDGYGFWERDDALEVWLCVVVKQMDEESRLADWKREIRDDFLLKGTAGFNGCIYVNLKGLVTTAERRRWTLSKCEKALADLEAQGKKVKGAWINSLFSAEGSSGMPFIYDDEREAFTDWYIPVGKRMIDLLRGNPTVGMSYGWDAIQLSEPVTRTAKK